MISLLTYQLLLDCFERTPPHPDRELTPYAAMLMETSAGKPSRKVLDWENPE